MNFNYGNNFSFLFQNNNSNNYMFGGINLSDYASIKSGSYGKLMKAYYTEQKKTDSASKSDTTDKTDSTSSKSKVTSAFKDNSELGKVKNEASQLKSSADALAKDDLWKQKDGKFDTDKIMSAVKDFVKEYNDTITQTGKVNSKDVSQSVGYMKSMTNTMSKALSKIGVSVDATGKLSLNEDAFKKADMKDAKALFAGGYSYGSEISQNANQITNAAVRSASLYGSNATLTSPISGMFDSWV